MTIGALYDCANDIMMILYTYVGVILWIYPGSHSYGEYVFDHTWANAFYRYGGSYYPKLQSCVPFTPATGPRILVRAGPFRDQVFDGLVKCMQQLTDQVCFQLAKKLLFYFKHLLFASIW